MEFLVSRGPSIANERRFKISDPPNNPGEDSEFLIPKQHKEGFGISDPPRNAEEDSEFLIPQRTQRRVQNFIPNLEHRKRFRISDPLKWHTQGCWISDHLQRSTKVFRISDPPQWHTKLKDSEFLISHWTGFKQPKSKKIPLWAQSSHKICS